MQSSDSLPRESTFRLPIKLQPRLRAYAIVACAVGSAGILWLVGISLGRRMPVEILYISLGMAVFMLAYLKNKTIRLDEAGMTQGFSAFRISMKYEKIASVCKETRSAKGVTAVVLVVYKKDSARKMIIPISSFSRVELGEVLDSLRHMPPQARIEADEH